MSVLNKIVQGATKLVSKFTGLSQEESARNAAEKTVTPGMPELLRRAAAEGAVLLKNENATLPLANGTTVSLFGRGQTEWFYTGYGSGGDVNKPYAVSLLEACEIVRLCLSTNPLPPYIPLGARKIRLTTAFGGTGRAITRICR